MLLLLLLLLLLALQSHQQQLYAGFYSLLSFCCSVRRAVALMLPQRP
jgi:hypothetical protein